MSKKYCLEVTRVIKETTKVICEGKDLCEATALLEKAHTDDKIDFSAAETEEEFDYHIDLYSCKDDYSFDAKIDEYIDSLNDETILVSVSCLL